MSGPLRGGTLIVTTTEQIETFPGPIANAVFWNDGPGEILLALNSPVAGNDSHRLKQGDPPLYLVRETFLVYNFSYMTEHGTSQLRYTGVPVSE